VTDNLKYYFLELNYIEVTPWKKNEILSEDRLRFKTLLAYSHYFIENVHFEHLAFWSDLTFTYYFVQITQSHPQTRKNVIFNSVIASMLYQMVQVCKLKGNKSPTIP